MMIDAALWLLRWTLAGAALSAIVIAAVYAIERQGRVVGLALFRGALLAALAAPAFALVPPVFTFAAPGTTYEEPERLVSRFIDKGAAEPVAATGDARNAKQSAPASDAAVDRAAGGLFALWLGGVAVAAIARRRSWRRLSRAFRDGAPFPGSFIECRLSADAPTPLLFGVLRPRMLAPADFPDWPAAERDAVLRHEAAHARRGDLVWAFIGDLVRIAYWWAPPVRRLVFRHSLATEEACDSVSFGRGENRHDYARALVAVARRVGGHRSPGLAMTAAGLRRRIERLISSQQKTAAAPSLIALASGAASAALLALSAPAAAGTNPFRIYIYAAAGEAASIYALSDGERAAAAAVEGCDGRLLPDAAAFIDELEGRIHNGRENELNPVWIVGPGSRTELGSCRQEEPHEADSEEESDEDSLVMIVDASERQARRFIRQIDALSRSERREMAAQLSLD
jgi:beta-lactamase regulating signal transducer with metallopeptidase domain